MNTLLNFFTIQMQMPVTGMKSRTPAIPCTSLSMV
jgi:hypothetical protein